MAVGKNDKKNVDGRIATKTQMDGKMANLQSSERMAKWFLRIRGWRITAEIVPFEITNSMKPHAPDVHAYTSTLRPVIGYLEPQTNP